MFIDMRDISRFDLVSNNVFVERFVISKLQGRLFSCVFGSTFSLEYSIEYDEKLTVMITLALIAMSFSLRLFAASWSSPISAGILKDHN